RTGELVDPRAQPRLDVLGERALRPAPVRPDLGARQAPGAEALGHVLELVELAPAHSPASRQAQELDDPARRDGLGEDRNAAASGFLDRLRHVAELQPEADVRLVRTVTGHRLVVREARKG